MPWLLVLFRAIGVWMRAAGLVTGNTNEDRRVFLSAFVALGGAALLRDVPEIDRSMTVLHWGNVMFIGNRPDANAAGDVFTIDDVREAVEVLNRNNMALYS